MTAATATDRIVVRASDGVELGAVVLDAIGRRRGIALLLHAMMVDRRSYLRRPGLPDVLAAAGFEVWVADFRGRGLSPCPQWSYDELVYADVPAWIDAARQRGPVAVVGHSLGGHVSLAAGVSGARADAYVALATNVWMPSLETSRRRRAAKRLIYAGFEGCAKALGRFPSRRVGIGPVDESGAYVRDLCRFWHEDAWRSKAGSDWLAALGGLDRPVLSVVGAGDRLLCHPDNARAFAVRIGPSPAELVVVGRQTGLPFDPGHMEIVTDRRAAPVWDRVGAWLERHYP